MLRGKRGISVVGVIILLIIILAVGYGIYKAAFAPKYLKIKDMEDMYIPNTRSSIEGGWAITAVDCAGSIDYCGQVFDNSNEYEDGTPARRSVNVCLIINQDQVISQQEEVNIPAGDWVELTHDGGRKSLAYLPQITREGLTLDKGPNWATYSITLYVAPDGSTYYDEKLTQLAQAAP